MPRARSVPDLAVGFLQEKITHVGANLEREESFLRPSYLSCPEKTQGNILAVPKPLRCDPRRINMRFVLSLRVPVQVPKTVRHSYKRTLKEALFRDGASSVSLAQSPKRFQYSLIREYTLNSSGIPNRI